MARSASRKPVRVGFTPMPRTVTRLPGISVAAASRNAPDERSPGTSKSTGARRRSQPAGLIVTSQSCVLNGTPSARIIRSV